MSRLKDLYQKKILPSLQKDLGYSNPFQVPRLKKVVLNMGVGRAVKDKKSLDQAMEDLKLISGQWPAVTKAKKAISGFSLRKGMPIGCRVTLRRERMYEFVDKLFNIVLPRTRDFNGLDMKGFDGSGNYSLGLEEQVAFPEVDPNKVSGLRGLQITIVTTAKNNQEAEKLLRALGCPLKSAGK
ncbi:50S ribosomal protein L5 [candidate division CPR3 bacterium 4484_211]|uniref:Large ribosomal subunit protein uL5 n=1 Tax=candidate division CPR3 bacterium 4484_211 TaxID=1968527 RepID=A0A1W9NZF9_UNCC3|nr:MAG: 50S ribosomal protein L5 [candidate division CPR3 bacterium 4484_211]